MTRYFEEVETGELLPTHQRRTDLMNWNRFAAVNDEFVHVHMDDEAAKARGDKGVLGMGNLRLAYMHCLLRNWMGDDGLVRRVSIQHRGINYKNDTLTTNGQVIGKRVEDGEHLVDVHLWVENQAGENTDIGQATIALPSREET